MTGSYLARHRTICAVLDEIAAIAARRGAQTDVAIIQLCDEAKQYAQSMSRRLVERAEQCKVKQLDK